MKKFILKSALALNLLGAANAFAGGYGAAGCGLGSVILGNQSGFVQVFAATTNGTFGSQTFGITSGTSNCGGGGKSALHFIEANKVALMNDAARGQGETIDSLASFYGCKNVANFGSALKQNYSDVFASEKAELVASKAESLSSNVCQNG